MAPKITIKERVFNNPILVGSTGVTTVMIGMATKGDLNSFQLISSLASFENIFGEPNPNSFLYFAAKKYLPYSPNLIICRIGDDSETKASGIIEISGGSSIAFSALSEGTWGNDISIKITKPKLDVESYAIEILYKGDVVERYINVNFDETSDNFIENKIGNGLNNQISKYVTVDVDGTFSLEESVTTISLQDGTNGDSDLDKLIGNAVKAIQELKNKDKYLFDVVIVPEVFSSHASIVEALDDLTKTRNDCFAPIDPAFVIGTSADPIDNIVKFSNGDNGCGVDCINLNNKNLGLFGFWQKDYDAYDKTYKWFPPSIYIAMDIARLEASTGVRWNSIAGLENGRLGTSDVQYSPSPDERELLYGEQLNGEIRVVNPIVKFAVEGITLWGQRTTERSNKPTNRINVVLMLNYVKQQLYKIGKRLQFQLNFPGSMMWNEYLKSTNSLLEYVKSLGGCENYTVVEPAETNTAEVRANNKFVGKIKITPTNVAEDIEFVLEVTPAGVTIE